MTTFTTIDDDSNEINLMENKRVEEKHPETPVIETEEEDVAIDDDTVSVEIDDEDEEKEEKKLNETEQLAIKMGWNPNFKGDKRKTAEEFVAEAENKPKVMKERLVASYQENELQKQALATQASLNRFLLSQLEEKEEVIRKQIASAKENYDFEAYEEGQNKLLKLHTEKATLEASTGSTNESKPLTPQEQAVVADSWGKQVDWINKYPDAADALQRYVVDNIQSTRNMTKAQTVAFLEDAERVIKKAYPEIYRKDAARRAPVLGGASQQGSKPVSTKRTFSERDLSPDDAKVLRYLENNSWAKFDAEKKKKMKQQFLLSVAKQGYNK